MDEVRPCKFEDLFIGGGKVTERSFEDQVVFLLMRGEGEDGIGITCEYT